MVAAYVFGKRPSSVLCLHTGILSSHVRRYQQPLTQLRGVSGRVVGESGQRSYVTQHLTVCLRDCGYNHVTHAAYNQSHAGTVHTTAKREKETCHLAPSQVVPEPGRRSIADLLFGCVIPELLRYWN